MIVQRILSIVFTTLLFAGPAAEAKVLSSTPGGFQIEISIEASAAPNTVYQAIIEDIGSWWDPSHSYSGKSENLYFDTGLNGCFGEHLPDGGFVRHLELVHLATNRTIRLTGGLGPLQGMGVYGTLTINLEPTTSGTSIQLTYNVSGYAQTGLDPVAPAVDQVLVEQLNRLQAYVEKKAR